MSIYKKCPELRSDRYLLRLTRTEDLEGLLSVYSDRNALPFFNSDNCNGDNFYYATRERMKEAMDFWEYSYKNGWFARMTIIEADSNRVIGTVELCYRASEDAFNGMCILRVDVGSEYETEAVLTEVFGLIIPYTDELLGTHGIVTKGPIYAVERIKALKNNGFTQSGHYLVGGHDGYLYNGYWTVGGC
ncbi:MAG: GNAT family N-acetyltransferase [Clostridia bacterium]|nr:GNAT family N-acetyltransferase [Clostridia bacterium]